MKTIEFHSVLCIHLNAASTIVDIVYIAEFDCFYFIFRLAEFVGTESDR